MDNLYLLIVSYLAFGAIAALVVHFLFVLLKKMALQTETKLDDLLVHSLDTPLTLLAFFIPLIIALHQAIALFPQDSWLADPRILLSFSILIGTWVIATFTNDLLQTYGTTLAKKTETEVDDRIIEILQKIGKYLIWFIGLLYILSLFDVNITPLIAGAGIAGIAIALAAQDIFSNFFGGAVIITDQPFQVGNRVLINDVVGDVIKIGPRSTRIITLDKDIVTIPNTKIVTSVVHNYSQPNPQVRIQVLVTVPSSVEIARVKRILKAIAEDAVHARNDIIELDPAPTIFLQKVEKSAMTFVVTVYARRFMYDDVIRDYLYVQIVERFKNEDIPLM